MNENNVQWVVLFYHRFCVMAVTLVNKVKIYTELGGRKIVNGSLFYFSWYS